jgi:Protein kinase domain
MMEAPGQGGEELVDPQVPEQLARALGEQYTVRGLVGRGGFAEVYEVWDHELQRRLAVKVLRPDLAWTPGMLSRFRQEARAVARLNHPNILPIHFVGQAEGLVYYAMPFVEGRSLGEVIRQAGGGLPASRAVALVVPLLDALTHAHERGLVHRDIKPDNILIDATTGRPMLVDFGIVKRLDGEQGHTQTGFVVGSPKYMSPEQALGQSDIDGRSDLYAVGAVLYQLVTGSPPFDGDTSQQIVQQHLTKDPPLAHEHATGVPESLSAVIRRSMAKSPKDRFENAPAMRAALERVDDAKGAGEASHAPVPGRSPVEEPTEIVRAGNARGASQSGDPGGRKALGTFAVMALAAAIVVVWVLRAPRLLLTNQLAVPVVVTVNARAADTIAPGASIAVRVRRRRPLVAHWTAVRPLTPSGAPMGVVVEGRTVEANPRGRIRATIDHWPDSAFFAPLITNATDRPLAVIINAGLAGSMRCGCIVAPGSNRAMIGYYPLFENSTVRVEDADGRSATFEDLGPQVDRTSGTIGLRFETRDLNE